MPSRPRRQQPSRRNTARRTNPIAFCAESLEPRRLLSTVAASAIPSVGTQAPGGLAGKVIYTSGGHGLTWKNGTWTVLRSYVNGMMEDMGNQDQLEFFAQYLVRAGATVVSMRPVGHQVNEVIVDNASAGFSKAGTWTNKGAAGDQPYWSNNNGSDAVHYVTATTSTTETASAKFTPTLPTDGFYPVYAWQGWTDVADQTFRINYAGGSYEVKANTSLTGRGWIYLGSYYFNAGTTGSVEVTNKSATAGGTVVADAIRFGNGMGDWTEYGTHPVSGKPREDESALYWCYVSRGWTGSGTRVSDNVVDNGSTSDDESKNFSACDRYATYMNNAAKGRAVDRLWLSFHSNAGGGRGAVGLINDPGTTNQAALADIAGSTVNNEMRALNSTHEYAWSTTTATTFTGGYSEISSNVIGTEFDATIIEVAYHDNAQDAAMLKDPNVRNDLGRSSYHVAVKYFDQFDATFTNTAYLPEPPVNVRTTTDASGNVTVSWSAGPSSAGATGPYGNAATSYRVYTSANGYGFDGGASTTDTSLTITGLSPNAPTYFRVTAVNAGGESLASWVVVAKPQPFRRAPILLVNNYSRLDRTGDPIESFYFGTVPRVRTRANNTFDYVVQAAGSIRAAAPFLGVESCTDADVASGAVNLANYDAVIWLSGEQSSGDGTFTAATQPKVTSYLAGGGKLFVSGSEIAWDLVARGAGSSFFANTLHASYPADAGGTTWNNSDDAGTYNASGAAGSIFSGVSLSFDNGAQGTYDVDFPDKVFPGSGATSAMTYVGGTGGSAGIQYALGNTRLVYLGFPFETITTPANRNAVMGAVLNYFGLPLNTIAGTGTDDTIRLARRAGSPTGLDVYLTPAANASGTPDYSVDVSTFPALTVLGLAGNDTIVFDLSQGSLNFANGFSFDGGAGSNTLVLTGSSANDSATLTPTAGMFDGVPLGLAGVTTRFAGGAGADALTLAGGVYTFASDLGADTSSLSLTATDATVTFAASQTLTSLFLQGSTRLAVTPGGNKVVSTNAFSLAPTAHLDLADNDLLWQYVGNPPTQTIADALALAFHAGRWDNPTGIATSTGGDPATNGATAIGYADNAVLQYPTFAGRQVPNNTVLTKYTWRGDTNLSGWVDADDVALMVSSRAAGRTGWITGDFNYDGSFDPDDFIALNVSAAVQDRVL